MTQYAATAVADIDPGICGANVFREKLWRISQAWESRGAASVLSPQNRFRGPQALRFNSHLLHHFLPEGKKKKVRFSTNLCERAIKKIFLPFCLRDLNFTD